MKEFFLWAAGILKEFITNRLKQTIPTTFWCQAVIFIALIKTWFCSK